MPPIRAVWLVVFATAAGIAVRLAFGLGYWVDRPLTHDEREYLALARSLASGAGFKYPPDIAGSAAQQFGRAPLYPWLLSHVGGKAILDPDPVSVPDGVKIAQSLLGGLGVPVLAAVAWRVAGPVAAALTALIAAIHPPLVASASYALTEAVFIPVAWLAVWLLTHALERHATRSGSLIAAAAGVAMGLAILTRPGTLILLALAVLWLATRGPRQTIVPLVLGAVLVVAPWTLRNVREHGRFVLVASEGGITFWTGNHPLARGEGDMAANPQIAAANRELRRRHARADAEELEAVYYREALEFIAHDPVRWLGLLLRKVFYLVVPVGPSYAIHSARYQVATIAPYLLLLPFAMAGAPLLWRAGARGVPFGLMFGSAVATALIFFPQDRFRIPVIDPTLIICASAWLGSRRGSSLPRGRSWHAGDRNWRTGPTLVGRDGVQLHASALVSRLRNRDHRWRTCC